MAEEPKTPSVFLAMPVYHGWDFLDETLRSIASQEFRDFRLLTSIDGGDERSAAVCAKYMDDPRFDLFLHQEHLGWASNLNWLMTRCSGEYFCFWQQDDLCATSYLRMLHKHATQHPEASCSYADVQWFGSQVGRWHVPSVTGPPLTRVLSQLENGYAVETLGLIRRSALEAAGPLRINAYDSRLEDFVWAAKLAREGELHHVPGTLYFKRAHGANAHSFSPCPKDWLPCVWREYGLGLLEAALPLAKGSERVRLLWTVLERLIVSRPQRWMAFEPAQEGPVGLMSFANEFADAAAQRFAVDEWKGSRWDDPKVLIETLEAHVSRFERKEPDRALAGLRELQLTSSGDSADRDVWEAEHARIRLRNELAVKEEALGALQSTLQGAVEQHLRHASELEFIAAERLTEMQQKDKALNLLTAELVAREEVIGGLHADLRRAREEHREHAVRLEGIAAERLAEMEEKDKALNLLTAELEAREEVINALHADLRRAREEHREHAARLEGIAAERLTEMEEREKGI